MAGGLAATMQVVTAAAAILVDATVVGMVLVPVAMQVLGRADWWLPAWQDRALPCVRIEAPEDPATPRRPTPAPV